MLTRDVDELVLTLSDSFPETSGTSNDAPFLKPVLQLLARGKPVDISQIATTTGLTPSRIRRLLRVGGAEMDEDGLLVGMGLTIRETPHRFEIGGRTLYTWCALDTLMFPAVVGRALVESPCQATGTPVRVEVSAAGVERVEPAEAVVSLVRPRAGESIRSSFCNDVHFFRSAPAAVPWLGRHPGAIVLPVVEAFEVGRRLAGALLEDSGPPDELSSAQAPAVLRQ
jgi:alkylmercury lyase